MFKVMDSSEYHMSNKAGLVEVIHNVDLSIINTIMNSRLDIESYNQSAYLPDIELVLRLDMMDETLNDEIVTVLNNMSVWNHLNTKRIVIVNKKVNKDLMKVLKHLSESYREEKKHTGLDLTLNIPITAIENIRSIRTGLLVEKQLLKIKSNLRLVLDTNLVTCS